MKPNEQTFRVGTPAGRCLQSFQFQRMSFSNSSCRALNQRRVFQEIVNVIFYENFTGYALSFPTMYAKGHNVFEKILGRFLNCMIKNFMRNMCEEDNHKSFRKFCKLTSG